MQTIKLTKLNQNQGIQSALEVLKTGGLVVFPTDTVYGLLADATNSRAIDKLLAFKERPPRKAISVFVANKEQIKKLVVINQNAQNIINNLLPGPFTVICQSKNKTDLRLQAENGTLGFRLPDYPLINQLAEKYQKPITATSANLSSRPPHYSVSTLLKSLSFRKKELLDLVVDAGKLAKNKPSTVIDTTSGELKTLRLGDILPDTPNSLISKSEKETLDLAGFILSKTLKKSPGKPIVFLLQGELGTGKTIFTKGLGKALKIKQQIVSPTYTLSYEYPIFSTKFPQLSTNRPIKNDRGYDIERPDQKPNFIEQASKKTPLLIHYDLYRLENNEDLKEIELLNSIKPGNIYSIEWPEKIDQATISELKKRAFLVFIRINHLSGNQRKISWSN